MRKMILAVLMALALFASTMTMCSAPIVQANYWNADGYLLENDPLIVQDFWGDLEDLRHFQSITVLVCGTDEGTIAERDWGGSLQASLHNLYVADTSERWQYGSQL